MSTGDLNNNLQKLLMQLRNTCVSQDQINVNALLKGDPRGFLPLLHAVMLDDSRHIARLLAEKGYNLHPVNDQRFVETVFRVLRNEFSYRPSLTIEQFLSSGYAERKLIFLFEVIKLCKRKGKELQRNMKSAKPSKIKRRASESGIVKSRVSNSTMVHVVDHTTGIKSSQESNLKSPPVFSTFSSPEKANGDVSVAMNESLENTKTSPKPNSLNHRRPQPVKAYHNNTAASVSNAQQQSQQTKKSNAVPGSAASCGGSVSSAERDRGRAYERSMECWVTSPLQLHHRSNSHNSLIGMNGWGSSPRPMVRAANPYHSDNESVTDSYYEGSAHAESPPSKLRHSFVHHRSALMQESPISERLMTPSFQIDRKFDQRVASPKISRKLMLPGGINGGAKENTHMSPTHGSVSGIVNASTNARYMKPPLSLSSMNAVNPSSTSSITSRSIEEPAVSGAPSMHGSVSASSSPRKSTGLDDATSQSDKAKTVESQQRRTQESPDIEKLSSQFTTVVAALEQLSQLPERMNRLENILSNAVEALDARMTRVDAKVDELFKTMSLPQSEQENSDVKLSFTQPSVPSAKVIEYKLDDAAVRADLSVSPSTIQNHEKVKQNQPPASTPRGKSRANANVEDTTMFIQSKTPSPDENKELGNATKNVSMAGKGHYGDSTQLRTSEELETEAFIAKYERILRVID